MNPARKFTRPGRQGQRRPVLTRTHIKTGAGVQGVQKVGSFSARSAPAPSTTVNKSNERGREGRRRTGKRAPFGKTNGAGREPRRGQKRQGAPQGRRRSMTHPPLQHRHTVSDANEAQIPPITDSDTVRVIPISGVEEIGRNMTVVETKDDIVVFDAGFQFVSEESEAPGINYILPNTRYLEERKSKIRGLVITHGHLDHIGGIPFIMERIGNPPVYTQYLTSLMVLKRQDEFPHLPPIDMHIVEEGSSFTLGSLTIGTFPVTHSIPDSMGVIVKTKHGNIVITGDIKLTHVDGKPSREEEEAWGGVGKENNILLVADSTNAEREGFSAPEASVHTNIEEIIRNATGRLLIGTFASQFERLIKIIEACERMGKKVVTEGRSIKVNIEIAQLAKLINVDKSTFISAQEIENYPADRIVILSTGAQGEEFAALMRMATNKHKYIKLTERDTIVFSSSVVPGNEIAVQKLKDNIYRRGTRVVHYRAAHIHASGHGNIGELVWIHKQVKPRFLMPVHGHHSMLRSHAFGAIDSGFPKENIIVPDNGSIVDIRNGTELILHKVKAPSELVLVDGFTVGERQEVVIRDRQSLAQDGMFVVIATVNVKTGKLRKSPDIISRGFVYLRESQQLLAEARLLIKKTVEKNTENMHPLNLEYVKDQLTETLSSFLLQRTDKTPMVIPVLIGI